MGSSTSTRWRGHQRRLTVEECCGLPAHQVVKATFIEKTLNGYLYWRGAGGFEIRFTPVVFKYPNGSIAYQLSIHSPFCQFLNFFFVTPAVGKPRWAAICPRCARKHANLYFVLPSSGFACRRCLGLAYASNHKTKAAPKYQVVLRNGFTINQHLANW